MVVLKVPEISGHFTGEAIVLWHRFYVASSVLFFPLARAPSVFSPSHTTQFAARADFWVLFSVAGNLRPSD